jgi:hypothetical protein
MTAYSASSRSARPPREGHAFAAFVAAFRSSAPTLAGVVSIVALDRMGALHCRLDEAAMARAGLRRAEIEAAIRRVAPAAIDGQPIARFAWHRVAADRAGSDRQ